jgi:hypothetical protein
VAQCGFITVDLLVVSQCIAFRYYTWIKATNQAQAPPPARPVDLEALNQSRDDNDESNDVRVQEKKATGSD